MEMTVQAALDYARAGMELARVDRKTIDRALAHMAMQIRKEKKDV